MNMDTLYDTVAETYITIITTHDDPTAFHQRLLRHIRHAYPTAMYVVTDDADTYVSDEHYNPLTRITSNC